MRVADVPVPGGGAFVCCDCTNCIAHGGGPVGLASLLFFCDS